MYQQEYKVDGNIAFPFALYYTDISKNAFLKTVLTNEKI